MADRKLKIHGDRITLRRTTEGNLPDLMALWSNGSVMKWVGFPKGLGYDLKNIKDWFSRLQAHHNRHHFVVHSEGVGFCGEVYYTLDRMHQRAGLDIKFSPKAQGQGLATDALKTLIRLVFKSEPCADAVWTEPSEENAAARKLYERYGLKPKPRPSDMEQGHCVRATWQPSSSCGIHDCFR